MFFLGKSERFGFVQLCLFSFGDITFNEIIVLHFNIDRRIYFFIFSRRFESADQALQNLVLCQEQVIVWHIDLLICFAGAERGRKDAEHVLQLIFEFRWELLRLDELRIVAKKLHQTVPAAQIKSIVCQ